MYCVVLFLVFAAITGCSSIARTGTSSAKTIDRTQLKRVVVLPFAFSEDSLKVVKPPADLSQIRPRRGESTSAFDKRRREALARSKATVSGVSNAGEIVTNAFISEVFNVKGVEVLGVNRVKVILKEMALDYDEVMDKATPLEVARIVGADAVFIGTVFEFFHLKHSDAMLDTSQVSVSVKLVDARSGSLMWSNNLTLSGKAGSTLDLLPVTCPSPYELATQAVKDMVDSFQSTLSDPE